jgi:decaprenylphospho-beta-D-erythro-pentofuranosid-2-ulose 2-reductase
LKRVLVLGATSAIAQETARLFAARGDALHLIARNPSRLTAVADDLRTRGASAVTTAAHDLDLDSGQLIAEAAAALGGIEIVLLAHGVLGDAAEYDQSAEAAARVLQTNLVSPVALLTRIAPLLARGACIAAISSVAGDRGRKSNGVYGASKAGLDAFLSALRNRLFARGIRVVTIKPGFVDTPMTAHIPKNALFASPATVARGIVRAVDGSKDVVYLPFFWRLIMLVIRALPERIFKRLSL